MSLLSKIAGTFTNRQKLDAREVFYFNKIYFKRISSLFNVYKNEKEGGTVHQTTNSINPLNFEFGAHYNDVLKTLGPPKFFYDNKHKDHNHKALIVRQTITDISFTVQFQFHNNQLFFVGFDMSRKVKSEDEKRRVTNNIVEKYLEKSHNEGDAYPLIEDKKGNFMMFNDDVTFSICYFGHNVADAQTHIMKAKGNKKPTLTKKEIENMSYTF